jgi:hypothetical protein
MLRLLIVFLLLFGSAYAQPNQVFLQHFTGTGDQELVDIVSDQQGNIWSAFNYTDKINYQDSVGQVQTKTSGGLILVHNPNGDLIDELHIDGPGYRPLSIAMDSEGNLYLFGLQMDSLTNYGQNGSTWTYHPNQPQFTIVKYDSAKNVLWHKGFEDSYNTVRGLTGIPSLKVLGDTAIYFNLNYDTGFDADPGSGSEILPTSSNGDFNTSIVKLDSAGNYKQHWAWPGVNFESGIVDIEFDTSGGLYALMVFRGNVDLDPNTSLTDFHHAGQFGQFATGTALLCLDPNSANLNWVRTFFGSEDVYSRRLRYDAHRDWIWVGGSQEGPIATNDIPILIFGSKGCHLIAYNKFGFRVWYGNTDNPEGGAINDLYVNSSAELTLIGNIGRTGDLNPNRNQDTLITWSSFLNEAFIIQLDSNFQMNWARTLGKNDQTQSGERLINSQKFGLMAYLSSTNSNLPYNFSFNNDSTFNKIDNARSASLLGLRECKGLVPVLNYSGGVLSASDTTFQRYQFIDCFADTVLQDGPLATYTPIRRSFVRLKAIEDFCEFETDCLSINDVSLAEQFPQEIRVYPNPGGNTRIINNPSDQTYRAQLFYLDGRLIKDFQVEPGEHKLELGETTGFYELLIYTNFPQRIKLLNL